MSLKYDPEIAAALEPLLAIMATQARPALHDVQARRAGMEFFVGQLMAHVPETPNIEITVHEVPTADGHKVPVHAYRKKVGQLSSSSSVSSPNGNAHVKTPPTSAVLHVHGGGMIAGAVGMFTKLRTAQVDELSIPFFSVDYRLAPEANGTTLVDDTYAALQWLSKNAGQFNVDPARIIIFGDSAGGGIAAGVALKARDEGLSPPLAKQILIYPMLDDRNFKVDEALEPLAFWKNEDNITGWTALLGKDKAGIPEADVSYYSSPARAPSLQGLPPTYIDVGTLDYFRDEDLAYAARLVKANVETEFHLYPGAPHAWEGLAPKASVTVLALQNRNKALLSV